jgi:transcriptional regulator with XRE-family HTH domain
MITLEYRKRIREQLPHGSVKAIADAAGVRRNYVSIWFSGKTNSETIEKAVFDFYIKERKRTQEMLAKSGLL